MNLINRLPNKSCDIYPIPATCLKQCVDQLTPVITEIINLSLICGLFPELLRHALVRPLLKKPNLDPEILQNYRPVSNFSLISKFIEKPVCDQLKEYIFDNNLYSTCKSAYMLVTALNLQSSVCTMM